MKRIVFSLLVMMFAQAVAWGAPILTDANLSVRQVVAGLSAPTTMAFIGANDFLVLQKNDGRVRRVTAGALQAAAVLDAQRSCNLPPYLASSATQADSFVNSINAYLTAGRRRNCAFRSSI